VRGGEKGCFPTANESSLAVDGAGGCFEEMRLRERDLVRDVGADLVSREWSALRVILQHQGRRGVSEVSLQSLSNLTQS
jgi:hypothetical protein